MPVVKMLRCRCRGRGGNGRERGCGNYLKIKEIGQRESADLDLTRRREGAKEKRQFLSMSWFVSGQWARGRMSKFGSQGSWEPTP